MPLRRYSSVRGRKLSVAEALAEKFAMSRVGYQYLLRIAPRIDRFVIPRTNGKFSSAGVDKVGLLTTTGAKSGKQITQPITLIDDGDALLAIGSNYGRATHPGWSANLLANPACFVEFRGPRRAYTAGQLQGDERARAWDTTVDFYAGYERYRVSCAPRQIRVFRLTPT